MTTQTTLPGIRDYRQPVTCSNREFLTVLTEARQAGYAAIIANNDAGNPISVSEWARLAEIPRKTLTDYLAEMRRKNWIETIGEGCRAKQAITNEGKAFINQ